MRITAVVATSIVLSCASAAFAGPTVQPGLYEITSKLTAVTARDMPPGMAELLTSQPAERRRECISPKGSAELHKAVVPNTAACPMAQNASGAGRISVVAGDGLCPAPVKFKVNGSYRPANFEFTIFSETPEGTTTWAHTGKRVGNCTR